MESILAFALACGSFSIAPGVLETPTRKLRESLTVGQPCTRLLRVAHQWFVLRSIVHVNRHAWLERFLGVERVSSHVMTASWGPGYQRGSSPAHSAWPVPNPHMPQQ